MSDYRSIFLAPDWQHVRYLDWHDSWPHPDFRVMHQRRGPVMRVLVVSALSGGDAFAEHWRVLLKQQTATTDICLHDLTGDGDIAEQVESDGLVLLPKSQRLLNIATFVIDLAPDEEALFLACSSDTRRKVRKAEKGGLVFNDRAHDDPTLVARFLAAFNTMARERSLSAIDGAIVRQMISDGMARLFAVGEADASNEAEQGFVLSYETAGTGFFLSGASERTKQNDGAGHLLQWGAIQAFKAAGHRYYDMGGLAVRDSQDGIYRFKKGFGGQEVDLGLEYGRTGALAGLAKQAKGMLGRLRGRI